MQAACEDPSLLMAKRGNRRAFISPLGGIQQKRSELDASSANRQHCEEEWLGDVSSLGTGRGPQPVVDKPLLTLSSATATFSFHLVTWKLQGGFAGANTSLLNGSAF